MGWLMFLFTVIFQMKGEYATDNIWWDQLFDQMLRNQTAIQSFFGWMALGSFVLWLVLGLIARWQTGNWDGCLSIGCLGWFMVFGFVVWLVGFLQIYLFGYMASHFTPDGALPGFWPVAILVAWLSLAR